MIDQFLAGLLAGQHVVITTHVRPDGDAIGSQLALGLFLQKLGKTVEMINSDPPPMNLGWLPGVREIQTFDQSLAQRERIDRADTIIVVDTNAIDRVGQMAGPIRGSSARKVLIDHHTGPEQWFDAMYVRDTASSAGELVYELIAHHDADLIDASIATPLYAAILTDTGSFRFSSVTPAVHHIVGDLIARGSLSPAEIYTAIYESRSAESLRLLAQVLGTLTLRYQGTVGYIVISQRMLNETRADSEEADGFVNYAMSIEGVRVAVMFLETARGIKISFRSRGETHVHEWARSLGGGGHRNASGAFVERRPLDDVIAETLERAPRFIDVPADHTGDGELDGEDASYYSSLLASKSHRPR
ncbi:MAG: bifunctional oligoribonuclease/PAP phosphatase NrnA [Rhodothermales bacterium]